VLGGHTWLADKRAILTIGPKTNGTPEFLGLFGHPMTGNGSFAVIPPQLPGGVCRVGGYFHRYDRDGTHNDDYGNIAMTTFTPSEFPCDATQDPDDEYVWELAPDQQ